MATVTFHLRVLSPDKTMVDGRASAVIVPGMDGNMTVLPSHMALITSLRAGEIEVHEPNMRPRLFKVTGGFADIGNTHCTILAEGLEELSSAAA